MDRPALHRRQAFSGLQGFVRGDPPWPPCLPERLFPLVSPGEAVQGGGQGVLPASLSSEPPVRTLLPIAPGPATLATPVAVKTRGDQRVSR